jgi:hypothetical protein
MEKKANVSDTFIGRNKNVYTYFSAHDTFL